MCTCFPGEKILRRCVRFCVCKKKVIEIGKNAKVTLAEFAVLGFFCPQFHAAVYKPSRQKGRKEANGKKKKRPEKMESSSRFIESYVRICLYPPNRTIPKSPKYINGLEPDSQNASLSGFDRILPRQGNPYPLALFVSMKRSPIKRLDFEAIV